MMKRYPTEVLEWMIRKVFAYVKSFGCAVFWHYAICYLQLLDSCLKSPLLPAYLAASFAKKLSRLLLSVPPSGALVITALIHNILRRHPSINCLVHRVKLASFHPSFVSSITSLIILVLWIASSVLKMLLRITWKTNETVWSILWHAAAIWNFLI